jgi:hypothetical protein
MPPWNVKVIWVLAPIAMAAWHWFIPNVLAIWRWLGTLDWAAISTVGLLIFAAVQWKLMDRIEARRRKERRLDKRARLDVAYGALWAEYARMMAVAAQWEKRDLVSEALLQMFDPNEILPRDWGASTQNLGELGRLPADFGGASYMHASQAASQGHTIVNLVTIVRSQYSSLPSEFSQIESTYPKLIGSARRAEKRARESVREAELCLKDALDNSGPGQSALPYSEIKFAASAHGKWLRTRLTSDRSTVTGTVEPPLLTNESQKEIDDSGD